MERNDYNRGRKLLILGNGFDVDLGMKSRYSDFANSELWKIRIESSMQNSHGGLLKRLVSAKNQNNWFDIEQIMMDYVRRQQELVEKTNYNYDNVENDEVEYSLICKSLKEYLREESTTFSPRGSSTAENVIKDLYQRGMYRKVYTFNYTILDGIAGKLCMESSFPHVFHVHGSLAVNDDIILGLEGKKIVPEPYKFMYKTSSRFYQSNNLYEDLAKSDEVVFFGHSINGMDFEYFRHFFEVQSDEDYQGYRRKWIRIFTYDNNSAMDIKYSLRENGIDPISLYRLNDLDFILCKDLENEDNLETRKYKQFVKDIEKIQSQGHRFYYCIEAK